MLANGELHSRFSYQRVLLFKSSSWHPNNNEEGPQLFHRGSFVARSELVAVCHSRLRFLDSLNGERRRKHARGRLRSLGDSHRRVPAKLSRNIDGRSFVTQNAVLTRLESGDGLMQ
jgi:hypothetical protein